MTDIRPDVPVCDAVRLAERPAGHAASLLFSPNLEEMGEVCPSHFIAFNLPHSHSP